MSDGLFLRLQLLGIISSVNIFFKLLLIIFLLLEKIKLVIFSKFPKFRILSKYFLEGLKCITIEFTFGFGKKQLGDTRNFFIISSL